MIAYEIIALSAFTEEETEAWGTGTQVCLVSRAFVHAVHHSTLTLPAATLPAPGPLSTSCLSCEFISLSPSSCIRWTTEPGFLPLWLQALAVRGLSSVSDY